MSAIVSRAREIINAEAAALANIPLDSQFELAVELIYQCTGKVITTGVGKAGHIAQKIAGTLCSTGTPAAFLHPADAAHGDMGLMSAGDVILAFSTSGKTREIIEMLELSSHLDVHTTIGITSHPDSQIRSLCKAVINMGIIKEPCKLGLTPSASSTAMLGIGDALALCVMEKRNFTREQFGLRHHGGYLGHKAKQTSL